MNQIASHYGDDLLYDRILEAVDAAGIDIDRLTAEDLRPVDEFHIGGAAATENLLADTGLAPESRVLDVGSGLGGTSRYLAETGSHAVTGVDLTPEYVEVAKALNRLVGLDESVAFYEADVLSLPFPASSFDAAVQLHVGMNIEGKLGAFAEVSRVLRCNGIFAIYDIMGDSEADLEFPMPWAASPAANFLATADEYVAALEAAGFEVGRTADRTEFSLEFFEKLRSRTGPPPPLGLHVLMGTDAAARYGNMVGAVEAGLIAPVEILARKRA